jgi:hypothetical protein
VAAALQSKQQNKIMNNSNLPKPLPHPIPAAPKPQTASHASLFIKMNGVRLPEIDQAGSLLTDELAKPSEIIAGVLHGGTKAVLASGSKVGKTWILLDLAIAVATGTPFLKFETQKKKVLFINFEIRREFIAERLKKIQKQKHHSDLTNLCIWNLRGQTTDFETLTESIIQRVGKDNYTLIILDPIYKAMVGKSENVASSVGVMCNQIERIVEATGAAVIFAHHYAKGNAAKKNQMDRMSGSGVFARDADTIITLTEHEQKDCYSVEMTLRNLAPQPPFVIQWNYPVMVERPDLSPADFKSDEAETDEYEPLIALLDETPLSTSEWLEAAMEIGYSRATFFRYKENLVKEKLVHTNVEKTWSRNPGETSDTPAAK